MRIGFMNIARGIQSKVDVVEKILDDEDLSVVGLVEVDLQSDDQLPIISGFYNVCDDRLKKMRVCIYVREGIEVEKIICPINVPAVVIDLA